MPNLKGGKNYKKAKGGDDGPAFIERADDQLYGRVIKNLGNCNMIVYCNDNKRRFCHIRGAIRKRVWMNPGDVVLVSVREFEKVEGGEMERGDIIAKYDARYYGKLKKIPDFNQRLLCELEKVNFDSDQVGNMISGLMEAMERGEGAGPAQEDGFEFDHGDGVAAAADADEEEEEKPQATVPAFSRRNARMAAINADDSIDIDAI